jgi:long-subunit acyl-CoA synthetase (AMP-forming)
MHAFFEALAARANIRGAETALVSAAGTVSYTQLIERVRGHAQWAQPLPSRVGLLFSKGPEQILADLALSFAGKELVPLPDFFSDAQMSHIIHATQLSEIVVDPQNLERAARLGVKVHTLATAALPSHAPADDAGRIIFTSGTTGNPKGVSLRGAQLLASVAALAQASGAVSSDRYLSVLPGALLLEQIAGTYLPLSVGAMICVNASGAAQQGNVGAALARAAEQTNPTATVLVPELLGAWLRELQVSGQRAPQSLRFVAVGGAPVSGTFADAAWGQGLPIYEGYGLSECSSVVALNTPGARRPGTVGKPLPDVQLTIENGEIVVNGPTLMVGYIGETPRQGPWHTGDLGRFDEDGFLWISGRKDNVIVTAAGRNINPEWVEEQLTTDTRIKRCVVVEHERELVALVIPHDSSLCHDAPAMHDLVKWAARELPEYAKPRRYLPMSYLEFRDLDLLTANARPRRSEAKKVVHDRSRSFLV